MDVEVEDRLPCSRTGGVHKVVAVGAERITNHLGDLNGCGHDALGILDRDVPKVGGMALRDDDDVSSRRRVDVHDRATVCR